MANDSQSGPPEACFVWRRVHRPEEYVQDVAKYVARETGIPYALMFPVLPVASAMLKGWDDAAVEHTEYLQYPGGDFSLRTVFEIHNYSNSSIYRLLEDLLEKLGVGRKLKPEGTDVDFVWLLLGGVLNDYAACAGVSGTAIESLLDFRLRNSDYLTVTTWRPGSVEIANLRTGAVDTLELPADDVSKIVDWAIGFQRSICGKKSVLLTPECDAYSSFENLMKKYVEMTGG